MKCRVLKFLFVLALIIGLGFSAAAQNSSSEQSGNDYAKLNLIPGIHRSNTLHVSHFANNEVYIRQAGNNNGMVLKIKASSSDIEIWQKGDDNQAYFDLRADHIQYDLTQLGNGNRYLHFNTTNPELISVNTLQTGNDLDIIVHGNNSISEKLKVNMKGDSRTLIIRNFN